MIETINQIESAFSKIDPTSALIVFIFLIVVFYKFRAPIMEFLRTYFIGDSVKKRGGHNIDKTDDESSSDSNTDSPRDIDPEIYNDLKNQLADLKSELKLIKSNQADMILHQTSLNNEFSTFKDGFDQWKSGTNEKIDSISDKYDFLSASDREDKRSYIVREYNYFYIRLHKIDFYSREVIEKSYEFYLREDGDTFVASLMTAIRSLPVVPQITQADIDEADKNNLMSASNMEDYNPPVMRSNIITEKDHPV